MRPAFVSCFQVSREGRGKQVLRRNKTWSRPLVRATALPEKYEASGSIAPDLVPSNEPNSQAQPQQGSHQQMWIAQRVAGRIFALTMLMQQ